MGLEDAMNEPLAEFGGADQSKEQRAESPSAQSSGFQPRDKMDRIDAACKVASEPVSLIDAQNFHRNDVWN